MKKQIYILYVVHDTDGRRVAIDHLIKHCTLHGTVFTKEGGGNFEGFITHSKNTYPITNFILIETNLSFSVENKNNNSIKHYLFDHKKGESLWYGSFNEVRFNGEKIIEGVIAKILITPMDESFFTTFE